MSKAEIQEKVTKMKVIRQKVIEGMEDALNQRYLYTIPYKEFYLTNSDKPEEVGFSKHDVFVAVKQLEDSEGNIKRLFELYDDDLNKIAETDENGRLKYDKEITEELIKMKQLLQKQNEEQGTNLKIAGLDEAGELEAYMQMLNHEIISLTAEQKKKLNSKEENLKNKTLDNKKDEEAMEANNQKELKTAEIASDLGISPQEIYQITEIKDDTFLRSEGITNGNELCAIKTRTGELQIVTKNSEGKFEKSKDFSEGTNETGRTTYSTNSDNNLDEANTYGVAYFLNDPDKRISTIIGPYGEVQLVKQERVKSNPDGNTMSNNETWSPGVLIQTDNTPIENMDFGGVDSQNKLVSNNREPGVYNNTTTEKSAITRKHTEELKPQDIAKNPETRGKFAFEKVQDELTQRGIEMSSEEKFELERKFKERGTTFCQEEVEDFCDRYEQYKEVQDENKSKDLAQNADKSNQNTEDLEQNSKNERTLEEDALERLRRHRKN
ncbi:MAG: hypothetical protein J6K42_01385 [Clostridia bacterium]|nr:hypothetical protein [Clostridia bacterium]